MGIFGIYFLICTCLLFIWYAVLIWFDLRGNKGRTKDDTELISTGDMVDTETSTDVRELVGGGYQLNPAVADEEDQQDTPVVVVDSGMPPSSDESSQDNDDGQAPDDTPSPESSPSVDSDPDPDPDPEPSQFERAKQIHDEKMNPVERIYQEQLNYRELMVQMACPLSQKTRMHRHRAI